MLAHTLKKHPDIRFGLFSNTADTIIRAFMSFGWGNGEHDYCGGVPPIVPAAIYEDGRCSPRADYEDTAATYYIGQTQVLYNFGQGHRCCARRRSGRRRSTACRCRRVGQVIAGEVTHVGP